MKQCKRCQEELPLSSFYVRKSGIPYTMCKSCYLEDKKERNSTRTHRTVSQKICRECGEEKTPDEFHRNYSQSGGIASICKECAYLTNLETKYKITNISELMEKTGHRCQICGTDYGNRPYVDHDHSCCSSDYTCGKCFRGLLCPRCNTGLGMFGDNVVSLSNAVTYVSNFNITKGEKW